MSGARVPFRVLQELCTDASCKHSHETHWHNFSVQDFLKEDEGEYTVTLRIKTIMKRVPQRLQPQAGPAEERK